MLIIRRKLVSLLIVLNSFIMHINILNIHEFMIKKLEIILKYSDVIFFYLFLLILLNFINFTYYSYSIFTFIFTTTIIAITKFYYYFY